MHSDDSNSLLRPRQPHAAEETTLRSQTVSLSVAHDLNAPLRRIQGFAQALAEDYGSRLDDRGRRYLERIQAATKMMQTLVDGLLSLASYGSHRMERTKVDLSKLVQDKVKELRDREPARKLEVSIASPLATYGDQRLIQVVIENLLENAWKFSANRAITRIEFGAQTRDNLSDGTVYFVRDNGIGFRTADAGSLFQIFGRTLAPRHPGTRHRTRYGEADHWSPWRSDLGRRQGKRGCHVLLHTARSRGNRLEKVCRNTRRRTRISCPRDRGDRKPTKRPAMSESCVSLPNTPLRETGIWSDPGGC